MILPYRGLGSGIKRALDAWPEIDFIDDRDGCLFTATVHRKAKTSSRKMNALPSGLGKTSGKILAALVQDVNLTIPELASLIGVTERSIERNIKKLQEQFRLRRVGPAKGGHWEIIEWQKRLCLKSGDPITEDLVREIYMRLLEGDQGGAAAPHEYRRIQNYVLNSVTGETIYKPPPAHDAHIMMSELGR